MGRVLVDQNIAVSGHGVTRAGNRVDRYDGEQIDDDALVSYALENDYDVLVFSGDAHLVSEAVLSHAAEHGLTVVVSREPHPIRAAERTMDHADALIAADAGSLLRLLSSGPREVPR